MVKKFAENELIELLSEDQLVYATYKPETCISLREAQLIMELFTSFCNGNEYLILQDMNHLKWIDKASREFFANHPFNSNVRAWAYHAANPIHQVMYNIYLTFSKPVVETNFFTNPSEGLQWLLSVGNKKY